MANEREYNEEQQRTRRISPYQEPVEQQDRYAEDVEYDESDYEEEAYEDEFDDEDVGDAQQRGGFMSTLMGKIVVGVIALLIVVLVALLTVRFLSGNQDAAQDAPQLPAANAAVTVTAQAPAALPTDAPAMLEEPKAEEPTKAPGLIVFAPTTQATAEPTEKPTAEPTEKPAPTSTPLPIVLSNTATPSPTPTVNPTPSPTFTPSPTATPEPTAMPEIGRGEVNRDANLRESASSSGKVKETIKQGEAVTIHSTILDKDNKIWYNLTVNDMATSGWMRDYVIDLEEKIEAPTHTPKATETPAPDQKEEAETKATPEPTPEPEEGVIGTGTTKKEANLRKVMNGKVLVQLRKGRKVDIYAAKTDKDGNLWYEVKAQGGSTRGFVRDYLIRVDDGANIPLATASPAPEKTEQDADETEEPAAVEETKEPSILDREVIGKAKTKREANVRAKPVAGAKLVRQLSKGVDLMVLDKYQDADENIWYEVCTETGKTHGYVRDYLLEFSQMDLTYPAKTYSAE